MARMNLLDTRTANFGDLIANGKIYRVPIFQRDYSWTEENWEDLWQDILLLYENPGSSHYMGAIVLQNSPTSDKEFTIIDGQQRLATLSIIAIAIIQKIQDLIEQDIDKDANEARQEILKRTYLMDQDPGSLRYRSKIILNENNNDFYQSYLINFRKPPNLRASLRSNQLLWRAFNYFTEEFKKMDKIFGDGKKAADFLTDIITRKLLFIQINVEDELNAYTVFETLNYRGVELSTTDLLKNYLFSLFQSRDDLQEAQRQWKRIINTVQMEEFPEFLRYYLSLQETRIKRERLFKIVRQFVNDAVKAFELLDSLESYSTLFIALSSADDELWQDSRENRLYITELELFGIKQAYPILLAAYEKFKPDDFTRLLKLICIISFRYTVVSSLNPNELESVYNHAAINIMNGSITSPRQVFNSLNSVYVSDEKFEQDFSLLSLPTRGRNKKLVRYILWKLESDTSGRDIDEDSFSIEHILPESPGRDWQQTFTDKEIDDMVYRLGNLTPLEPSLNRQIGNESYDKKHPVYQQSQYSLTRDIQGEEWTPKNIVSRQRRLATRAVHVWRSDFAG